MSKATLTVAGGGSVDSIELDEVDFFPTEGDLLMAAQVKRSKILALTEAGLDIYGVPFENYNDSRPYYYYPSGPVAKERSGNELKNSKAGVKRFARKVGRTKGAVTGSGLGLRFDSYRAFKETYLGRENVDLRGPRAPHMLQEIVVKADGVPGSLEYDNIGIDERTNPASNFTIGIYGTAAARANGNNERRQFFGSTAEDNARLLAVIVNRAAQRLRKRLRGQ